MKIAISGKIAILLSAPTLILAKLTDWTFSNQDYIISVLICIAVDHLIGSYYHAFKTRDFTFKKNIFGLIQKLGLCVSSVILFEILHTTLSNIEFVYNYLKITTRLIVILYPTLSAFLNMSSITNGSFPPIGWIKKLKKFNENIDITDLK
ncbi:MAG: hypothetical protein ACO1N9_05620 [Flavobacterium sp.]